MALFKFLGIVPVDKDKFTNLVNTGCRVFNHSFNNVEYYILSQSVHHSWQMKEQLLGIYIGLNVEKIDKLSKLQDHLLWQLYRSRGFSYSLLLHLS